MDSMLTTTDNPFNPFIQWDDWLAFDEGHDHYTCALLDRVTITSDQLSDEDQDRAIEEAIDEIVREDVLGLYMKVLRG